MQKLFGCFLMVCVIVGGSCKKSVDQLSNNHDTTLSSDSTSLHLSNTVGAKDSFTVTTNVQFVITNSAGSDTWFTTNIASGQGTTKIKVTTAASNPFDTMRRATITIRAVTPDSSHVIIITVIQNPQTQVNRSIYSYAYGGSKGDFLYGFVKTTDGSFVAVGTSLSNDGDATGNHGGRDLWLLKVDSSGKKVWQHQYGGSADDYGLAITSTPEGGFLSVGVTQSNDMDVTTALGGYDAWIIKTDANGNKIWAKSYGTNRNDTVWSVVNTPDGGYVVVGSSIPAVNNPSYQTDIWIFKIDNNGNVVWDKKYGGSSWDGANWIAQASDGGYLVTGYSLSTDGDVGLNKGGDDTWLGKIDENGNLMWHQVFGGSGADFPYCINKTFDGGYLITGTTSSSDGDFTVNHGRTDFFAIKTDISGNKAWQKTYGGSSADQGLWGQTTSDGGYILAGISGSSDGDLTLNRGGDDGWLVKTDASGNIVWQQTFGGGGEDVIWSAVEIGSGSFEIVGSSASPDGDLVGLHGGTDGWIIKIQHN
ncbi:MAG: secretion protein [Bacteroidetes bacterium]|nr:MAG: secretion protein [Bacteroidota bacterium]